MNCAVWMVGGGRWAVGGGRIRRPLTLTLSLTLTFAFEMSDSSPFGPDIRGAEKVGACRRARRGWTSVGGYEGRCKRC